MSNSTVAEKTCPSTTELNKPDGDRECSVNLFTTSSSSVESSTVRRRFRVSSLPLLGERARARSKSAWSSAPVLAGLLGMGALLHSAPVAAQAAQTPERDPPGAAGDLPSTMDKIAAATDIEYRPKPGGHRVKFNLQDADLAELVNHISGMTGRRFIYGAKVRSIKATVVSPEPVTLEEAYQAFLSILEVNGMTVVPHGRFLKIVDSAGVTGLSTPIYDRGAPVPNADSYVTRIYRTRYVNAEEAAQLLAKFKSKEGDVSSYGAGNLLIITDTGSQIRRMIRILEELDVGGAGQQMWIEKINHGNASDMAQRINDLFEVGQGGGGLSKVIADEQTNSLIVVGTDDSYGKLIQILRKLDAKPGEAGRVHVLKLQHAVSEELAKTLQQMLTGQGSRMGGGGGRGASSAASSGGGNAGGMFEGDVTVTPDQATNALIVTSSPRDFAQLRMVVDKLDQPRRQVFIEAVIMDVGVSDTNSMGFSWHGGLKPEMGGDSATLLGGFEAGKSVAFPTDPTVLQGLAAGVRGPDLEGTANLLGTGLSIPAFGMVVNAMASSGRGNVLATPHVIATDNVAAEIYVGENIPLQTNVGGLSNLSSMAGGAAGGMGGLGALGALGGFGTAPRQDVGNKVKVTPHINESDQVRLEIEQESSAKGTPEGTLGAVPITKRTAKTTVVVKDQQTVVIGGLMQDTYTTSKSKVPILGDIPVLGFLFSSTKRESRKTNLLLILTPHVIREQDDLRRIYERKFQERQEFIDRYFVFATDQWKPPMDYSRTNGLVEDIRQAFFEVEELRRLEEELKPREVHEHVPSDPIDLPGGVKSDSGARSTQAPARGQNVRPPTPVQAPPPAAVAPGPQGDRRTGAGASEFQVAERTAPLQVAPASRNVRSSLAE